MMNKNRRFTKRNMNKRMQILFILCLLVSGIFLIRLFLLQTFNGEVYKKKALEQRQKTIEAIPDRGSILDRNKEPLAISVKLNIAYLFPQEVEDLDKTTKELEDVLGVSALELQQKAEEEMIVRVKSNLSNTEVEQLQERSLRGVTIAPQNARYYPNGSFAPHLIGFTDDENRGVYGIEAMFDEDLHGIAGVSLLSITATGEVIPYDIQISRNVDQGKNVVLTMDKAIQNSVNRHGQDIFDKYQPKKISIVVMNPNNGDILAMENFPKYDPNNPRAPLNEEEEDRWRELTEEQLLEEYYKRWRSFAINDLYEPGSVFKFITAAAAVEEGSATVDSHYLCEGEVTDIPGIILKCYRWYEPHGDQTLFEAMDHSCNPAFIQMARELGRDKFYKYIRDFGFGDLTGIDLPAEQSGMVPNSKDEITEAYLATMSYGHGVAVTPIQVITALSAVINGGDLYVPRIVKEILDTEDNIIKDQPIIRKRQVISEETSKMMREMMEHGVQQGTADGAKISGYRVGGKTGTSVKFVDGEYTQETTVASYIGVFPADQPEYIVLAVVDEPQGATSGNVVAAPIVRDIIKDIIRIGGYEPTEKVEEVGLVEMPYLVGMTLEEAAQTLNEMGLKHSVVNPNTDKNSLISSQAPKEGDEVPIGQIVDLMSDETGVQWIQMPDPLDRTMEEAIAILEEKKIAYEVINRENTETEIVIEQNPGKGVLIDPDSTVQIKGQSREKSEENE